MRAATQKDPTGYSRLVGDGHYADAPSGLWGKFDNVRRNWENQITRFAVRPALARLSQAAQAAGRGLRIADLGCGAGEGLDLLLKVPVGTETARGRYLIGWDDLDSYHGIDLCPTMITQAKKRFAALQKTSFAVGDLSNLGTLLRNQQPFDLYYNSYGSLSHLDDVQLRRMIDGILAHQAESCALVIDVHGQYSPEWPLYWNYSRDTTAPRMQPYNMVWMYPESERAVRLEEQRDYRIRYWRGDELRQFVLNIPGVTARQGTLTLVDRSVLVGRHMDTASFCPTIKPLRRAVNALFEFNSTTTPDDLRAETLPATGDQQTDEFFSNYVTTWNALVDWFDLLINQAQPPLPSDLCAAGGPVPAALRGGMEALVEQSMRRAWFSPGDPEANLLQPQFGLLLRQFEFHAQRGLGCGHGLLAVLELGSAKGSH
ncbi:MAG: class I SAM-dependent methyltransferase [Planctomycetota bacterium]